MICLKRWSWSQRGCSAQGPKGKRNDGSPCGTSPDHNLATQIIFHPVCRFSWGMQKTGRAPSLLISIEHFVSFPHPYRIPIRAPLSLIHNFSPRPQWFRLFCNCPTPYQFADHSGSAADPKATAAEPSYEFQPHTLELGSTSMKFLG